METIPTELIDLIVEAVPFHDLHSLALTCRRLLKCSIPALYNTIVINTSGSASSPALGNDNARRREKVKNLCRTIVERPDLAKHIKTLQMRYLEFEYYGANINQREQTLFMKALDSLPLHPKDRKSWQEAIPISSESNFEAIVSLLVTQCVSLEKLSIAMSYIREYSWLWKVMKRSTAVRVFPQMHTVRVVSVNDSHEQAARHVINYFRTLPKVQQIILLHVSTDDLRKDSNRDLEPIYPLVATKPGASNLPALVISKTSPATKYELPEYLTLTWNLRTFVLHLMCPAQDYLPFELERMQTGLENVRSTLNHLAFRIDICDSPQGKASEVTDVCTGSLSFFRGYTALTTLETSLPLLFGEPKTTNQQGHHLAEVLPPNLQKLIIADDLWHVIMFVWTTTVWTMDVFKEFFSGERLSDSSKYIDMDEAVVWSKAGQGTWKYATPDLREFVFDIRTHVELSDYWDEEVVRKELRRTCEKQGIKCRVLCE